MAVVRAAVGTVAVTAVGTTETERVVRAMVEGGEAAAMATAARAVVRTVAAKAELVPAVVRVEGATAESKVRWGEVGWEEATGAAAEAMGRAAEAMVSAMAAEAIVVTRAAAATAEATTVEVLGAKEAAVMAAAREAAARLAVAMAAVVLSAAAMAGWEAEAAGMVVAVVVTAPAAVCLDIFFPAL